MAGKHQHHVWQLLQRGFGEKRKKNHYVWVYEKAGRVWRTSTRNYGAERHFYGLEGSEADEKITSYEHETHGTIQGLRKADPDTVVDREFAATLLSHLEMRTAFIRREATANMMSLVQGLTSTLIEPKRAREFVLKFFDENPDQFDEFLAKQLVAPSQRDGLRTLGRTALEALSDRQILEIFASVLPQLSLLQTGIPDAMKQGQNRILEKSAWSVPRRDSYMSMSYRTLRREAGSFILPDTTTAFLLQRGATPFVQKGDRVVAVVLPISSEVAIFGSLDRGASFSEKAINRVLASCAFEAFLAKEDRPEHRGLVRRIGKNAILLDRKQFRKIKDDVL